MNRDRRSPRRESCGEQRTVEPDTTPAYVSTTLADVIMRPRVIWGDSSVRQLAYAPYWQLNEAE